MAEVSAVVANYEGEKVLSDCLASLSQQTLRLDEVIVVDAGSTDQSLKIAESFGATILSTDNRGVGHLYNVGAGAARTPYVLLANNDVAFDPTCVELLGAALDSDAKRFAADPRQFDWQRRRVVHARSRIRPGPLLRIPLPGHDVDLTVPAEGTVRTLLAGGAAMLIRRDLLAELGGFDESFFMEYEEIDICWRAWLHGLETVYVPDAQLRHHVGHATSAERAQRRRVSSAHHNLLRFSLKCLPPFALVRVLAGELVRLPRHPILIAPAIAQIIAELPEILRARSAIQPSRAVYDWLMHGQEGPLPIAEPA